MKDYYIPTKEFPLNRINSLVTSNINRILKVAKCPINREELVLLREVRNEEALSQTMLAKRIGKDRNDLSKICKRLENKGIIIREFSPKDRRFYGVFLTEYGKHIHEQAEVAVKKWQSFIQGNIEPDIWKVFVEVTHKYLEKTIEFSELKDSEILPDDYHIENNTVNKKSEKKFNINKLSL